MNYSDVVNGVQVSRYTGPGRPSAVPRGAWMREVLVNEFFDPVTQYREGPAPSVENGNEFHQTYTVLERDADDAIERLKDHINDEILTPGQARLSDAGTTVSGMPIGTADNDLAVVLGELDGARVAPDETRKFKGRHRMAKGELTLVQMEGIVTAIRNHKRTISAWAYDKAIEMEAITKLSALQDFKTDLIKEIESK